MKQKLPGKKSSYETLVLGDAPKAQTLSNSWTKYSLIGFFIAIFHNKKHFVNSLDLQIITLSIPRDFSDSRNVKVSILKTSMLLVLILLTYRRSRVGFSKREIFDSTKFWGGRDYTSIYKRSIRNLNRRLDISLCHFFPLGISKKRDKNLFFDYVDSMDSKTRNENSNSRRYNSIINDWSFKSFDQLKKNEQNSSRNEFSFNIGSVGLDRKSQFINFVGLDKYFYPDLGKHSFEWIAKDSYMGNTPFVKPVLIHSTFPYRYIDPPQPNEKILENFPELFSYAFPETSSIDDYYESSLFCFDEVSENAREIKTHHLRDLIESDNTRVINLWKNYKPNLSHFFPSNSAYIMIQQSNSISGSISKIFIEKWNCLFQKIVYPFLPRRVGELSISINCIESGRSSINKKKELDVLINGFNKIENVKIGQVLPRNSDSIDSSDRDKLIKNFLFIEEETIRHNSKFFEDLVRIRLPKLHDSVANYCKKYWSGLLNNTYPKSELSPYSLYMYTHESTIHQYSTTWIRLARKSFVRNFGNISYKVITFGFYKRVSETNESGICCFLEKLFPRYFPIIEKLANFSVIFLRELDPKDRNRIKLSRLISANSQKLNLQRSPLLLSFHEFEESINKDLGDSPYLNAKNTEWIDGLLTNGMKDDDGDNGNNNNSIKKSFEEFFTSRKNLRFFLYSDEPKPKNYNSVIYSLILSGPKKYSKFLSVFSRMGLYISRKNIVSIPQPRLYTASLLEILHKKFGEDQLSFLSNFYRELSSSKNLHFQNFLSDDSVENIFALELNNHTRVKTHCNILYSESLLRSEKKNNTILELINGFLLYPRMKCSRPENTKYKIESVRFNNSNKFDRYNRFRGFSSSGILSKNYTSWFFTSEWWEYHVYIFVETFREICRIISYYIAHPIGDNIQIIQKIFGQGFNLYDFNPKWHSRFSFDYEKETISKLPNPLNNWNSLHWTLITLVICISLFYQNYFSILIGSDSIDLWKRFETIKYLTDTSRAFYFSKLIHRSSAQLDGTENIVSYFFGYLPHYARNIRFYLSTKKNMNELLITNRSLDLSRRNRNLSIQSLITHKRIKEYGLRSYSKQKLLNNEFGYRVTHQQGLLYLQYLADTLKRNLVNYPLHLANKWIFFASIQKLTLSRGLWRAKKPEPGFQRIPVPLQFGLSRSKGILLIGPVETGRSYLIKNLAAESCVPLLRISINKLLYNKPDAITESWTNILIESLRRLNLILDLARRMSPCIIWIQDIHRLNVNRLTENVESDPTFLLGILLKHLQIDSIKNRTRNNIVMIGSTHSPREIDPALISPNRLDRVINIRLFSNSQRKNQFSFLLNKLNFQVRRNKKYSNEFGSRTMGYNIRDLAAFTGEVSLISVTRNEYLVRNSTTELAFHRQISDFTHTNDKPKPGRNLGITLYKIGRAVVRNILVKNSATVPLSINNFLCKKRFYYLSKWYSELPPDESSIKESTILINILGCLAGAAARDSWFLLEKDSDLSVPLDKLVENDFDLACSILENLPIEFPWLEICAIQSVNDKRIMRFSTMNFLSIMRSGIFALTSKSTALNWGEFHYRSSVSERKNFCVRNYESGKTTWSPRSWRLSFSRSHLFDWIKRPNDTEIYRNSKFSKKDPNNLGLKNRYGQFVGKNNEQLIYGRILPGVRGRNMQELESQFEQILLEEQFEILGSFRPSTHYRMEYQLNEKPRLFIGKRVLWDPIGLLLQIRQYGFPRRDFFADEETLRRLYVTYGARRERERSHSNQRIRRFFFHRGYNKDLIGKLSFRWWDRLPMSQNQNTETLKKIEKIVIQLKRPRIFTPVYLYQRWLIENLPEKFPRFEFFIHQQRWLEVTNSLLNDSFIYTTLSESYQYLLRFFLSNKILLNRMTKLLSSKGWLFQDEIVDLICTKQKLPLDSDEADI